MGGVLTGVSYGCTLHRSIRLAGGRGALVLQWLLSSAVKQLAGLLRVRFGDEFRAARASADKVGGCLCVCVCVCACACVWR
jgi:pheromone shutdown protein TraB